MDIHRWTRALGAQANCTRFFVYLLTWNAERNKHDKRPVGSPAAASMTFAQAVAEVARVRATGQQATVGMWVTADSGLVFVDVDAMPEEWKLDARGTEILAMFPGAFAEWSVGRHGIHVIAKLASKVEHSCRNDALHLECYTADRGVALNIDSEPNGCMDVVHDIAPLVAKYFPPKPVAVVTPPTLGPTTPDDELWQIMLAAKPSAAVVFDGKISLRSMLQGAVTDADKNSNNDMALAQHLAFWCRRDPVQMKTMMLRSGMSRLKWTAHATYLDTTIATAIAQCAAVYTPRTMSAPLSQAPTDVRNAADLLRQEFRPVQWAIRDFIPEGVTILSGDPKIGKSWLSLQACIAVAGGVPLWNGRLPETQGDALYLSLEDNDRRLKRRLEKLIPKFPKIQSIDRLHFSTEWPRGEEGVVKIAEWLRAHPDCRLLVIDTISAFRDSDPGRKSAYAHDYDVGQMLRPLSREFSCGIVLIMHNRKQQASEALHMVSGTQGLTGGVDNVLVLRREPKVGAALYVDGRDIENQCEIALKLEDGKWQSLGNAEDARRSDTRTGILEAIVSLGGVGTIKDIYDAIDGSKSYESTRSMMLRMMKDGELDRNGKLWTRGAVLFGNQLPPTLN